MKGGRRNLTSGEEPNAFRITRAPPTHDTPISPTQRDSNFPQYTTPYSPTFPSAFSRPPPHFHQTPHPQFEPASWLAASELSSPTFSAHHFLQRALKHRSDSAARPSHLPLLDDAFDADAALAALDTVESALRKKRDISRRDEEIARDDLRKALHLSAKKREQLSRTADAVLTHIATFGDVGRHAAAALANDVRALQTAAGTLTTLQDARDLVCLLTLESGELDAVRVSKLLSNARLLIEDGSLSAALTQQDMNVAREEMARCESELATSVETWMIEAVKADNIQIVRDCALAAEQLGILPSFIESYVSHLFSFDEDEHIFVPKMKDQYDDADAIEALEPFRVVRWETVNALKGVIHKVCESFSNPAGPLASLLRLLAEKKILVVLQSILNSLEENVRLTMSTGDNSRQSTPVKSKNNSVGRGVTSKGNIERFKSLLITDIKEPWRENTRQHTSERRRYLIACADIFRSLSKLQRELFDLCRLPGVDDVLLIFRSSENPYVLFSIRHLPRYLRSESIWIDEQLGSAFADITRIEVEAPRLAPREKSSADVYHRYRAFYTPISSNFQQMTRNAIESTYEALCRAAAVLSSMAAAEDSCESKTDRSMSCEVRRESIPNGTAGGVLSNGLESSRAPRQTQGNWLSLTDDDDGLIAGFSVMQPSNIADRRMIMREILDSLVMSYLANAETSLQAATHLLPVCENDAKGSELWMNGSSPLTAYVQAVEVLAKSNELLDEFLLTLELSDHISELCGPSVTSDAELAQLVPRETREILHGELTSGLSDLGTEAQIGVRAAIESVRSRLFGILSTPLATGAYTTANENNPRDEETDGNLESNESQEIEPSPAFIAAASFIEQQLHSVLSNINGGNREFVISELGIISREAVLHCWCACAGPFSTVGALQIVADGRAIRRVFQNYPTSAAVVECLAAIGQLFLESADGLWRCVESKALAEIEARTVVRLLMKRSDFGVERVIKVCQSLGATLEELQVENAFIQTAMKEGAKK